MSNAVRALTALACGIIVAAFVWSEAGPGPAIVGGIIIAAIIPFLLPPGDVSGGDAMRDLSSRERIAVMRSVLRGERVPDPRLAPAAIGYAEYLQSIEDWGRSPGQVAFALVGIIFWCVMGAAAIVNERYTGLIIPVLFIALGAWSLWSRPRWSRQAQRSERANRPLLGPGQIS